MLYYPQEDALLHILRLYLLQEDALLCGPPLEPFLRFAYAGAPWQPAEDWVRGKPWLAGVGGNGGLSLRRRSLSLACLDATSRQRGQWEDAFFIEVYLLWLYWYLLGLYLQ